MDQTQPLFRSFHNKDTNLTIKVKSIDVVPEPEERCADGDVPEEGEDRAELSFNHLGRPAVQAF